ncbi:hypothetical protein [Oenococcus sicerae]|uniref:hypothetical protein n=1 Tax=Oenococcus sicerae TaxID=2203724 RepID=UPI0010AFA509|nr:hypothetical protein OAL24_00674 [Oenococcus sicerae]
MKDQNKLKGFYIPFGERHEEGVLVERGNVLAWSGYAVVTQSNHTFKLRNEKIATYKFSKKFA